MRTNAVIISGLSWMVLPVHRTAAMPLERFPAPGNDARDEPRASRRCRVRGTSQSEN
jgi:hypothetical protein